MALIVKARSWSDISKHYEDLSAHHACFLPMLQLVQQLANSRYALGLFPATSHSDLMLGQTEAMEMGREMIWVSVLQDGQIRVEVQEQPSPVYKTWNRITAPDKAFELVEKALTLKKWFPRS